MRLRIKIKSVKRKKENI